MGKLDDITKKMKGQMEWRGRILLSQIVPLSPP